MCGAAYNPAQGWKSGSSSALRVGYEAEVVFAHSRLGGKAEDRAGVDGRGVCPRLGGEGEWFGPLESAPDMEYSYFTTALIKAREH